MIGHTFKKLLCFLLALFMIFTLTACDDTDSTPETPAESEPAPIKEFTPSENFVIIRSEIYASDPDIVDACYYVKKAFEAAYGYKLTIETDRVEATANSYEILIGNTNRKASQKYSADLYLNDYVYAIPSEKTIVICGGTPEKTLEAAQKFCEDILTYNGKKVESKNAVLLTNTRYTFEDTYQYSSVIINGILLEDYTFAISSPADIEGAVAMQKALGQYTGQVLPIILESEMTGDEESIIRIGASYRDGKGSNKLNGYVINNYVDSKGNVICVDAASGAAYDNAIKDLFSKATKVN